MSGRRRRGDGNRTHAGFPAGNSSAGADLRCPLVVCPRPRRLVYSPPSAKGRTPVTRRTLGRRTVCVAVCVPAASERSGEIAAGTTISATNHLDCQRFFFFFTRPFAATRQAQTSIARTARTTAWKTIPKPRSVGTCCCFASRSRSTCTMYESLAPYIVVYTVFPLLN